MMKAEVREEKKEREAGGYTAGFQDKGRGCEPRDTGNLSNLERARKCVLLLRL